MRVAVVTYNLGGPDGPDDIRPFLFNLFNDPMIIGLGQPFRWMLARFISGRRERTARRIYEHMGGGSPLLANTRAQAKALETTLNAQRRDTFRCFVMMRYWHPMCEQVMSEVVAWAPDRIVLLPLYPQFSTTTVGSMLRVWEMEASQRVSAIPTSALCCYPVEDGFVDAVAEGVRRELDALPAGSGARILFSAHGLPQSVIRKGDPYQWQVEQTARAVMDRLGLKEADWLCCYQSRVGPMRWIGPSTESEIRRAGADGKPIVLVPIAFVSEHSETLVELDVEYRHLADEAGVPEYRRVPTVGTDQTFIDGLARLVETTLRSRTPVCSHKGGRFCTAEWRQCPLVAGQD